MQSFTPSLIQDGLNVTFGDGIKKIGMAEWEDWNYQLKHMFPNAIQRLRDEGMRLGDAQYVLSTNEIETIRNEILRVLRWELVSPGLIPVRNIGKGMTRYTYADWKDVPAPRQTDDFEGGQRRAVAKGTATVELTGMDYDMHLSMPEIDYYTNGNPLARYSESLESGTIRILTRSLAQYQEWAKFRGSDTPNMTDYSRTGLVNDSGVTDPGALGADTDDDLTAAGDVLDASVVMANKLITAKYKPPFRLDLTPGVYAQALKNRNATTNKTDMSLIMDHGMETGTRVFSSVVMNPYLINSETETTSTGAMLCTKPGTDNFEWIESYPLGFYPLPPKSLGVDGKMLFMGAMAVYRGASVVYADALTTDAI